MVKSKKLELEVELDTQKHREREREREKERERERYTHVPDPKISAHIHTSHYSNIYGWHAPRKHSKIQSAANTDTQKN